MHNLLVNICRSIQANSIFKSHKNTHYYSDNTRRQALVAMSQVIVESSSSLQSLDPGATLVETEKYYCPFLERGFCRDLLRCNFSHVIHESIKIPSDYCHFYLANQCFFGQDCKFTHSEPNDDNGSLGTIIDTRSIQTDSSNLSSSGGDDGGDSFLNNDYNINNNNSTNNDSSEQQHRFDERSDVSYPGSDQDKANRGQCISCRSTQSIEDRDDANLFHDDNTNNLNHRQNNFSHLYNQTLENDQPSSSSQRVRALKISHRCAMMTPSTSTLSLTKLKLSANTASQSSGKNSTEGTCDNKTQTTASTANKSTWQGARLIASIRNNLGIGDQASGSREGDVSNHLEAQGFKELPMCPYSQASGECPFPEGRCNYLHGLVCDLCYSACLHPYDEEQRNQHREECLREHEREMELSFAVQRSKDKVCGICMDMVVEKKPVISSRFGILEKCNHIFCLDCIRKWRGTRQFDSRTIRACPECRVISDFVVPSKYWVEDQDDKDRLISDYKAALKYFNGGKGDCPFAGSCFYKHAYPDGSLAVMEAPKPRRRLYGARGSTSSLNMRLLLWNTLTSADEDDDDLSNDLSDADYLYAEDDFSDGGEFYNIGDNENMRFRGGEW